MNWLFGWPDKISHILKQKNSSNFQSSVKVVMVVSQLSGLFHQVARTPNVPEKKFM
jgi:hypothetical protein